MTISTAAPPESRPAGKLSVAQYVGYGGGDAANNLTFSLTSMFLLVYYTDVAGIAAGAAGTVLVVARVWGAFTDIVAGRIVDQTNTRWGRFRPYFLFVGPPLMLMAIALFSIPGALGAGGALAYAYVTYMVFYLLYSFVNIPFGSIASAMTQLSAERAKLSTVRNFGAALAMIVLAVVVAPQLSGSENLQRGLTITTAVVAAVGIALYLFLFSTSREIVERDAAAVSLRETVATVRHNKPLVMLCASALFFLTGMFTLQTLQVFYARDVLGNANYIIVLTLLTVAGMFLTGPVIPKLVDTFGKKSAYIGSCVVVVAGGVGIALSPASLPWLAFVFFGVRPRPVRRPGADVDPGSRHRGIRRVGDRGPYGRQQLRPALLRPQGRPGHRWRPWRLGHRHRRLRRRCAAPDLDRARHDPLCHRVRAGPLRRDRRRHHDRLPADRGALPGDGRGSRPPAGRRRRHDPVSRGPGEPRSR